MVDAVAAYSNLLYPHKNARAVRKLLAEAEGSTRKKQSSEPNPARRLRQRLGSDVVDQIVADYRSGIPTTELTDTYSISKHGILTLLTEAGVALRRQPLTDEQVSAAAMLYEAGKSLAAVARELGVAQESLRRALVNSGIPMRIRGGSKSKNLLVARALDSENPHFPCIQSSVKRAEGQISYDACLDVQAPVRCQAAPKGE